MEKSVKTTHKRDREQPLVLRILLACGVIGPLFFIVMFLIEGATRAGYSPFLQPVSSLSIGEMGWTQATNFLITGSLLLLFAVGLRQVLRSPGGSFWGPLLIGLVGIGLIGAGVFTNDPLNGYPPGTPLIPTERTVHGILHDLFSTPVFTALPAACFVFSRWFSKSGQRGWAVYSALTGIGMFAIFVLARLGFKQTPGFADFAGAYQRLSLIIGFTWIALLAVRMLKVPFHPDFADSKEIPATKQIPG